MEAFKLPDGTIAECSQDIDKYLKRAKMAMSGDFSPEYIKNTRYNREKVERAERFADFVHNYKRMIWNE